MISIEYVGIGYGISLWLITSGLFEYFGAPKTFSFVIRESDLDVLRDEELPLEVREYKQRLEESFRQELVRKYREESKKKLLMGTVLLVIAIVTTVSLSFLK